MKPSVSLRDNTLIFIALALASGIAIAMLVLRFLVAQQPPYLNLIWNLFLAWLPLVFAYCATVFQTSRWRFLLCAFLWLLFIPNSPYLVTDMVHLRPRRPIPFWFDILLVQSFALTGLLLGFLSLYLMHQLVAHRYGYRSGWRFTFLVLGLTALGVYLGRFEHWNSWDLFVNPIDLLANIADVILHPRTNRTAIVFSVLWSGFLVSAYLAFYALTKLHRPTTTQTTHREEPTNILNG